MNQGPHHNSYLAPAPSTLGHGGADRGCDEGVNQGIGVDQDDVSILVRCAAVFETGVVSRKTVTAHRVRATLQLRPIVQPGVGRGRRPRRPNLRGGRAHPVQLRREESLRRGVRRRASGPRSRNSKLWAAVALRAAHLFIRESTPMNSRARIPRRSRRAMAPGIDHLESCQLPSTAVMPVPRPGAGSSSPPHAGAPRG
jgi:hypothetical protein